MRPVRRNDYLFSNLFDSIFGADEDLNVLRNHSYSYSPKINILEDEKAYTFEVAAPGAKKENFSINIDHDNELVIKMENKCEKVVNNDEKSEEKSDEKSVVKQENKPQRYIRREFSQESFEQRFVLPDNVVVDEISASMSDGILKINVPKRSPEHEAKLNRTINIQ